ncbi:MAG: RNA methyltransferase [Anaerolineae bacterium]|nr:RNA methyltransferase [Anaerolineae bacterium]
MREFAEWPRWRAEATPTAQPYYTVNWLAPTLLLIGNEAHGISPAGQVFAPAPVMIPMATGVESLNAATAAAILLFEARRQRNLA